MNAVEPSIIETRTEPAAGGYREVTIKTARGAVEARWYPAEGPSAALLVGGAGGGFDTPADGLYPQLGAELPATGIAVLRVKFRSPRYLDAAVHDVLAGLRFLESQGKSEVGLVGHSLGGAVVIQAAARSPTVKTVVTLATQSYGADPVAELSPRPILLLHGTEDEVLPVGSSVSVWKQARDPRELRLLEGAGHVLDEAAEEVRQLTSEWLRARLAPRASRS